MKCPEGFYTNVDWPGGVPKNVTQDMPVVKGVRAHDRLLISVRRVITVLTELVKQHVLQVRYCLLVKRLLV